jgi:hypothetical protein
MANILAKLIVKTFIPTRHQITVCIAEAIRRRMKQFPKVALEILPTCLARSIRISPPIKLPNNRLNKVEVKKRFA